MSILETAQMAWQELVARIARAEWNLMKYRDLLRNKSSVLSTLFTRNSSAVTKFLPACMTKCSWCLSPESSTTVRP